MRFYAVDVNTDYGISAINLQPRDSVPDVVIFPAFHKTSVYKFGQSPDPIAFGKFIKQNADINFELKSLYFSEKKPDENAFILPTDEHGNIKADSDAIKKLQEQQMKKQLEEKDRLRKLEEEMRRHGEL